MKVAFLGNMNNNHFAMARFLRDWGVDAHVLLFNNEFEHFHPMTDTYDLSYMEFCHQLNWGSPVNFLNTSRKQIEADVSPYDILIGCGLAPAYCHKIGRKLDIFTPYGSDIWSKTSYHLVSPHRLPSIWNSVYHQRCGIAQCVVFQMDYTNNLYEKKYQKFKGTSVRWVVGLPMVYTGVYSPNVIKAMTNGTHWGNEIRRIREKSDLLLFYHVRHVWGSSTSDPTGKGTDILLRGFALFLKNHPEINSTLILLEYGKDVNISKKLISELKIEDSVFWLPKMYRKDLMVGVALSDVICGEFMNSWLASGVIYEALAMAKPMLGYRNDNLYKDHYPELYPMLNARDPDSICSRLKEYITDPNKYIALGEQGRQWYEKYVVEAALEKYMGYINAKGARLAAAGK